MSSHAKIWPALVSFRAMSRAIDNAGIQRALGAAAFSNCGLSRRNLLWFMKLDAETETFLNTSFRYYQTARRLFEDGLVQIDPVPRLISKSKRSIIEQRECTRGSAESGSLSLHWFQSLSQFITVLRNVASATVRVIKEELVTVRVGMIIP